jgi:hypothetical protein
METVVVAPIVVDATTLDFDVPVVVDGRDPHIAMSELGNAPSGQFRKAVADLSQHEDDTRRALTRLFTGF